MVRKEPETALTWAEAIVDEERKQRVVTEVKRVAERVAEREQAEANGASPGRRSARQWAWTAGTSRLLSSLRKAVFRYSFGLNKERPWIIFVSTKFCQSFPPAQYISSLHCLSQGKLGLEQLTSIGKSARFFSEHCFACHGLDDPKGGLRLDFAEFAHKGGKSAFPAIAPGDPKKVKFSIAWYPLDMDDRMPPKGEPLKSRESQTSPSMDPRSGAQYAKHWAYVVPQRPALPSGRQEFCKNSG